MPKAKSPNADLSAKYSAPKLTLFGDVLKMTATGSKSGFENTGNKDGKN